MCFIRTLSFKKGGGKLSNVGLETQEHNLTKYKPGEKKHHII